MGACGMADQIRDYTQQQINHYCEQAGSTNLAWTKAK